jgi:hypothetical protein
MSASEPGRNRIETTGTWNIQETHKQETHKQSHWVHTAHLILRLSLGSVIA